MALESEYFPQAAHLSSLSPGERSTYKKIVWGLFGVYTAVIVTMGVVVVANASFQKGDVIAMARTGPAR